MYSVSLVGPVVDAGVGETVELVKSPLKGQESVQLPEVPLAEDAAGIAGLFQHAGNQHFAGVHPQYHLGRYGVFIPGIEVVNIDEVVAVHIVGAVALGVSAGK